MDITIQAEVGNVGLTHSVNGSEHLVIAIRSKTLPVRYIANLSWVVVLVTLTHVFARGPNVILPFNINANYPACDAIFGLGSCRLARSY